MQESDSACFAWLCTDAFMPDKGLIAEDLHEHTATSCTQDALLIIRDDWRTVKCLVLADIKLQRRSLCHSVLQWPPGPLCVSKM